MNSIDDGWNEAPLADGEYKFGNGGSAIIKNGVVESFTAPAAPTADTDEPKQQAQAATDKPQGDADNADGKDATQYGKPNPKAGGADIFFFAKN